MTELHPIYDFIAPRMLLQSDGVRYNESHTNAPNESVYRMIQSMQSWSVSKTKDKSIEDRSFIHAVDELMDSDQVSYWYKGTCPQTGKQVVLPRTALAEAIAYGLMHQLNTIPELTLDGKMFGILLVKTPHGDYNVLKAFSGLLNGQNVIAGWVPPIPGREQLVVEETLTVKQLDTINQRIVDLKTLRERTEFQQLTETFEQEWQELSNRHRSRKQQRQQKRQHLHDQFIQHQLTQAELTHATAQLDDESRMDGIERRRFKHQRDKLLKPLHACIKESDHQIHQLKQTRKKLSQTLQAQLHAVYQLTNFNGVSSNLLNLMPRKMIPTGTGDCCAPKLLHYAATHQLTPLVMAEFWWGAPSLNGDKIQGKFYGACVERCQPIMGFLLSGVHSSVTKTSTSPSVSILYEDDWLIAVNKPAGLLSVPGLYQRTYDSVQSRLRLATSDGDYRVAIHRLDRETSGILLVAKDKQVHAQLSQQFQQRTVKKIYVAVLDGIVSVDSGVIEVPIGRNWSDRLRRMVDFENGKASTTTFQVMKRKGNHTWIQFMPLTGRTHQLRIHSSAPEGIGIPILGDCLYGRGTEGDRLHLHASSLTIWHPAFQRHLHLEAPPPF